VQYRILLGESMTNNKPIRTLPAATSMEDLRVGALRLAIAETSA